MYATKNEGGDGLGTRLRCVHVCVYMYVTVWVCTGVWVCLCIYNYYRSVKCLICLLGSHISGVDRSKVDCTHTTILHTHSRVSHGRLEVSGLPKRFQDGPLHLQVLLRQGDQPSAQVQGGADRPPRLWRSLFEKPSHKPRLNLQTQVPSIVPPRAMPPLSSHGDDKLPLR